MTEEYVDETTQQPTPQAEVTEHPKEKQFFIMKILSSFLDWLSSFKLTASQKLKFLLMLYIALCFPFLVVYMKTGISKYLLLNLFLCFCFYIPGSIQALYMVLQSE